jgi:hypothetical protein
LKNQTQFSHIMQHYLICFCICEFDDLLQRENNYLTLLFLVCKSCSLFKSHINVHMWFYHLKTYCKVAALTIRLIMCTYKDADFCNTASFCDIVYIHMWSRERVVSVEMHLMMLFAMQRLSGDLINKIASVQIWPLHFDPIHCGALIWHRFPPRTDTPVEIGTRV